LLLWMTGCAVYFSLARHFLLGQPRTPGDMLWLCALAVYTGLCWTGAIVVAASLLGRKRAPPEPAAWWLFALGCILTLDLLVPTVPSPFVVRPESLRLGGTCLVLSLCTLSRHLPRRWKALFAALCLLAAGKLVTLLAALSQEQTLPATWGRGYARIQAVVGLTVLAAVVVGDRREKLHYGWLHWIGVLCGVIWLMLGLWLTR
jgi:hypothetical protein